ncbi:MAG: porin family protein [Rubricoccaceae bacterium]
MRTLLFAAALAFAAAPAAQAQATIGLKGGLNTSWFSGNDSDNTDPRLGAQAGLMARFNVNPAFALQAEALYSQKGITAESNTPFGNIDGTVALDYLEIPVLARVSVPASPLLDVGIAAGPSIGIPVRTRASLASGAGSTTSDIDARTDVGVAVGLDIGSGPFAVDARYTLGLTRPINDSVFGDPDVRNQNFNVSFIYLFGR